MKVEPIEINGDLVLSLAATVSAIINNEKNSIVNGIDITEKKILDKCAKANRRTILHDYIETICSGQLTYIMLKHFDREAADEMKEWLDSLSIRYDHIEPAKDDDVDLERYADDIQCLFNNKALPIISNAVFSILFQDKDFCYKFNLKLARIIKNLKQSQYPELLQVDGVLKRESPPNWLKDGVFYRDKGRCQSCGTDLTKLFIVSQEAINYDHIIPLRSGGSNDPTNYQLMCEYCNKSKGDRTNKYRNIIWPLWSDC